MIRLPCQKPKLRIIINKQAPANQLKHIIKQSDKEYSK